MLDIKTYKSFKLCDDFQSEMDEKCHTVTWPDNVE